MTYILGINAYHGDSAACLVKDGLLIAAAEEERFSRIKHWAGFPSMSIGYCLTEAGISLEDVTHVAVNMDRSAHLGSKILFALTHRLHPKFILDRLRHRRVRSGLEIQLAQAFPDQHFQGNVHEVEHHRAHLSSAFHVSPFEKAVVVSVDGFGDFSSTAWGLGRGDEITIKGQIFFPHSLGIFYQALTQFIGFPNYGDEYKVMGLAPYGEPKYIDEMRQIVRLLPNGGFKLDLKYFRHHRENINYTWESGIPAVGTLYSTALTELLGKVRGKDDSLEQKHKDIARSVQDMYEETFFHLLNVLHGRHGLDTVAIAGGCGMNSVANGKVTLKTPFKQVYVQSAAGDAGGAIGSAYSVWHQLGNKQRFHMKHAYWGPSFSNNYIGEMLTTRQVELVKLGCQVELIRSEDELCQRTALAIADGQVIGWFQGRMEWGPRALGNRSILGDPRRVDMKDILNLKIKRRESFRPFAPSILRESVPDWFNLDGDVPFMMQVYSIRENKRHFIPAVTHVDGSGRLQTVSNESNPRYYKLINAFREHTGVPMVLNTSFNENEPVVCSPEEGLECFLRTRMDLLVLGNWIVSRKA